MVFLRGSLVTGDAPAQPMAIDPNSSAEQTGRRQAVQVFLLGQGKMAEIDGLVWFSAL